MSVSLVLASGFLFLGGLLLAFLSHSDAMLLIGVILAVLGALPLLACQCKSVLLWYSQQPFAFSGDETKEDHHEKS